MYNISLNYVYVRQERTNYLVLYERKTLLPLFPFCQKLCSYLQNVSFLYRTVESGYNDIRFYETSSIATFCGTS